MAARYRRRRWRPSCGSLLLAAAVMAGAAWVTVRSLTLWVTTHPALPAAAVVVAGALSLRRPRTPRTPSTPTPQETPVIQIVIQTIGLLHPGARDLIGDGLFFDLSDRLRNPHADRSMRDKTGLDPEIRDHVLGTPGAMRMVEQIAEQARGALPYADRRHRLVRVTVACRGGRHRSVAIAEEAARYLRTAGIGVEVDHRHIDRPVVE